MKEQDVESADQPVSEIELVYESDKQRMPEESDDVNAASAHLEQHFDDLLQRLVGLKEYSVRQSREFADEITRLRQSEAELQWINEGQREHLEKVESEHNDFQLQMQQTIAGTESLREEHERALERIRELESANQERIGEFSTQNSQLETQLAVAGHESERLRLHIERIEEEYAASQQALSDQINAMNDSENHWKTRAHQLETQLAEAGSEIANATGSNRHQTRELQAQHSQSQARLMIAERTVQRLQTRIRELESEVADRSTPTDAEPDWEPVIEPVVTQSHVSGTGDEGETMKLVERVAQLDSELRRQQTQHRELLESYSLVQLWLEQERDTSQQLKASVCDQRQRLLEQEEQLDALRQRPSAQRPRPKTANIRRRANKRSTATKNKAAKAASRTSRDNLCRIEGVGPKIRTLLVGANISTFRRLAGTSEKRLQAILAKSGPALKGRDVSSWPKQAKLAAAGRWAELKKLQDKLK